MMTEDKKRLANAIKVAISDLDKKAKGFCYRQVPEYLEVRNYLTNKVSQLQKGEDEE